MKESSKVADVGEKKKTKKTNLDEFISVLVETEINPNDTNIYCNHFFDLKVFRCE
jgi:hypothetical protein